MTQQQVCLDFPVPAGETGASQEQGLVEATAAQSFYMQRYRQNKIRLFKQCTWACLGCQNGQGIETGQISAKFKPDQQGTYRLTVEKQ
jgi:hypothetical protein